MLRCTNKECRASLEFNIQATGDRYKRTETGFEKIKAGKRTKDLEDVRSYQAKCITCGYKDLVKHFMDAYNNPMRYFDADNLCDCGGEIWNDIECIKKDIEQEENFTGSQRTVPMSIKHIIRCEKCNKEF